MKRVGRLAVAMSVPLILIVAYGLATNRGETPPDRGKLFCVCIWRAVR
jgi:hypothetical protein